MKDLEEIEDRIYEAALVPELWPQLLDDLAPLAEAPAGVVMGFSVDAMNVGKLVANPAYKPFTERFYSEGWGHHNVRFTRGGANGTAFEPRFISEEDIFGSEAFENEPLYKDLLLPADLGRSIGTVFNHAHGDVVVVTFERRYGDGPVSDTARRLLDALRPHFARSSLLAYRLDFDRVSNAVGLLDQLGLPAAALRSDGKVVVAGRLFEAEPRTVTVRMGGRMALGDPGANRLLTEALGAAVRLRAVRSIPLKEPGLPVRKVLHLIPIRRAARDLFTSADVLVALSAKNDRAPGSGGVLMTLFDLTPREAQVAAAVAQGRTVREIAAAHDASPETVRNQLRVVLSKTGCARQSELVCLVADLFPSGMLDT